MQWFAAFILLAFAPAQSGLAAECAGPETAIDRSLAARIDPAVEAAVAQGFAGGVAIIRNGEIVYSRAAGDSVAHVPVTSNTLFHVASVTKYLTAALVLEAAQAGKLRLEQPLAGFFPGTKIAARGTTIADLLAHRSGLGNSYAAEAHADADAAVAAIDAVPPDETKTGAFRYSNDGYDLLAVILERTQGEPYERIARRFLERACVERFGFWAEVDLGDAARIGQPLRAPDDALRRRNYGMIGSAGFLVTAEDLARLQLALAGGSLLSTASRGELFAPRQKVSIGEATYGAFLVEHDVLGTALSARGFEDWGDNAIMNHYFEQDIILAVVTSKGPAEGAGAPFRDVLSKAIEVVLADERR